MGMVGGPGGRPDSRRPQRKSLKAMYASGRRGKSLREYVIVVNSQGVGADRQTESLYQSEN
jgi:hypothetical protein